MPEDERQKTKSQERQEVSDAETTPCNARSVPAAASEAQVDGLPCFTSSTDAPTAGWAGSSHRWWGRRERESEREREGEWEKWNKDHDAPFWTDLKKSKALWDYNHTRFWWTHEKTCTCKQTDAGVLFSYTFKTTYLTVVQHSQKFILFIIKVYSWEIKWKEKDA